MGAPLPGYFWLACLLAGMGGGFVTIIVMFIIDSMTK